MSLAFMYDLLRAQTVRLGSETVFRYAPRLDREGVLHVSRMRISSSGILNRSGGTCAISGQGTVFPPHTRYLLWTKEAR